jgi:hypothetical protein
LSIPLPFSLIAKLANDNMVVVVVAVAAAAAVVMMVKILWAHLLI